MQVTAGIYPIAAHNLAGRHATHGQSRYCIVYVSTQSINPCQVDVVDTGYKADLAMAPVQESSFVEFRRIMTDDEATIADCN